MAHHQVVFTPLSVDALVWHDGEPLVRTRVLPDPFTPQTGLWADNFGHGDIDEKKDAELIRSLREFGWPKGLEAIHDEYGVSLTAAQGGRRQDAGHRPGHSGHHLR